MAYLLDTQAFIWFLEGNPRLPSKARQIISDVDNLICLSIASLWEIGIKVSIGKLVLDRPFEKTIDKMNEENIALLAIMPAHILKLMSLEFHHKDPFDRIIASQAIVEGLEIISSDDVFKLYPVSVKW